MKYLDRTWRFISVFVNTIYSLSYTYPKKIHHEYLQTIKRNVKNRLGLSLLGIKTMALPYRHTLGTPPHRTATPLPQPFSAGLTAYVCRFISLVLSAKLPLTAVRVTYSLIVIFQLALRSLNVLLLLFLFSPLLSFVIFCYVLDFVIDCYVAVWYKKDSWNTVSRVVNRQGIGDDMTGVPGKGIILKRPNSDRRIGGQTGKITVHFMYAFHWF